MLSERAAQYHTYRTLIAHNYKANDQNQTYTMLANQ